ncbi:MAG TPA: undecaprenyl-phosphate glucose phosphotransferase, partial [Porphyromonadaceae bacterium]|nr:undecaprenyl-phosphate glucose phosphotransferase [Porphyromonadaceae bacterium]
FFKQQRTGINNKTFTCLKFRTMTVNDESDNKQAQVNDSRITSIGKFLRRSNIDELPQFINVFLGNMSVVGPRPHMLKHTQQYSELIRHYKVRHFVKPGITGWAQVNGYRGLTDELWKMEKRVEYDMEYLENWDLMRDIKIIFMTLFGSNAYKNAG